MQDKMNLDAIELTDSDLEQVSGARSTRNTRHGDFPGGWGYGYGYGYGYGGGNWWHPGGWGYGGGNWWHGGNGYGYGYGHGGGDRD
ncbi:hypothetical protein [Dictyobacter aurantiacus]|uniref:Uncharacterized protein n=1 Tax=Dictyobacter aurantiacus TaxID=1936993 RepID=A0A401ZKE4_9CHLR|nr:hypothetical protein [Dictyobacter aurantiacus]GCE07284.1 hypothetical protein KDAU_46130 [Dictyobacter aurantiacus]